MGTQKPGEWANLVLARFEEQVRDCRCEKRRNLFPFPDRFVCRALALSFPLDPSRSLATLFRCATTSSFLLFLPAAPNVTATMQLLARLLVDFSSTPFMGASWSIGHTGTIGLVPAVFAPHSPDIGFRVLSPLVAVRGVVDFSRANAPVSKSTTTKTKMFPTTGCTHESQRRDSFVLNFNLRK